MNSYFLCIKGYISYGQTQSCPPFNLYQQLRSTFDVCTLGSVPPCLQPLDSLLILLWFDLLPLISVVVWLNERAWDVHRTKSNPILLRFCVSDFFTPRPGCACHYLSSGTFAEGCFGLLDPLFFSLVWLQLWETDVYRTLSRNGRPQKSIHTNKQTKAKSPLTQDLYIFL